MKGYTVLYSREGYFIIFEKRENAFFYHNYNGGGTIYPPDGRPIPLSKGPSLHAFPGGGVDAGEVPFQACLREFREECGNSIAFEFNPPNQPQTLNTLNGINVNGSKYTIVDSIIVTNQAYYTLYLEFATNDLRQIQAIITNTNFDEANDVRSDIQHGEIRNYNDIFQGFPYCPLDDELGFSELWQIEREINEICLLNNNDATNWYYEMIMYLARTILGQNIEC